MSITVSVKKFRDEYKKNERPGNYSGALHFGFELVICISVIVLTITQSHNLNTSNLILIPVGFVIANLVEYLGHRYLLHINFKISRIAYVEHTIKHHHYFTDESIDMEDAGDLHRILFPWFGVLFFVAGIGGPIALATYFLWDFTAAALIFLVSVSYFLLYETIHLICHVPDQSWIFYVPGLLRLKRHHQLHHKLSLMNTTNFNIALPLFDYVFKTKKLYPVK